MSDFKENITKWATNDIEIKKLNDEIKKYRIINRDLSIEILSHIEKNNQEDNIFKIGSLDTDIKVNCTKVQESISYKYLNSCLQQYFKEHKDKDDSYHIENLLDYIKSNRTTTVKQTLQII
tara:strand:+ start:72 stop:434 length:363 start_codon:yes stop_codon:yes gene_type:complete